MVSRQGHAWRETKAKGIIQQSHHSNYCSLNSSSTVEEITDSYPHRRRQIMPKKSPATVVSNVEGITSQPGAARIMDAHKLYEYLQSSSLLNIYTMQLSITCSHIPLLLGIVVESRRLRRILCPMQTSLNPPSSLLPVLILVLDGSLPMICRLFSC